MAAYVVLLIEVKDPTRYHEEYVPQVLELIKKFGGSLLSASEDVMVKEGTWPADRTVILHFPDRASVEAWYSSDEYKPLRALRHEYADSTLAIVPGK